MKQDKKLRLIAVQLPFLHDREQISDGLLALSRQLKVNKFNLLGTSIGGYIAQWFTYSHPESVARLYICNSVIDGDNINNPSYLFSKYLLPRIPENLIRNKFLKELNKSSKLYKGLERCIFDCVVSTITPRVFSERALTFYASGQVPNLKLPDSAITIIDCDDDPYISEVARHKVLSRYPNASHYRFKTGHHFPYIFQPDKFNAVILDS